MCGGICLDFMKTTEGLVRKNGEDIRFFTDISGEDDFGAKTALSGMTL